MQTVARSEPRRGLTFLKFRNRADAAVFTLRMPERGEGILRGHCWWAASARGGWSEGQLILLAALVVVAFGRLALRPEADALTIAILSGLLFWTQAAQWRRMRILATKIEQLVARQRYGPLSAEDLEVIHALQAQVRREAAAPTRPA